MIVLKMLAIALALALAATIVQTVRLQRAQLQIETSRADAAAALASAERSAREAEAAHASAAARIAMSYEQGKTDAQATADRVVADLNAGSIQLRRDWAGCETARLSDAVARASEPDAAEQSRAERAGRIVRAAAACDAQVTALQALVRADREPVR